MESQTMTHRRFSPIIFALLLLAFLGATLSSCTSGESENSRDPLEPEAVETLEEGPDGDTSSTSPGSTKTAPNAADSASSPNSESAATQQTRPATDSSPTPSASSDASSANAKAEVAKGEAPPKNQLAEIRIDETICGAGGQEAYFETKVQEIYICKNEAGALTYIATPKKKGNSLFLQAQKIQQGELVGYAALDETKTYVVTSGGFQLQDNGKPTQSEKVIRRQLAKD